MNAAISGLIGALIAEGQLVGTSILTGLCSLLLIGLAGVAFNRRKTTQAPLEKADDESIPAETSPAAADEDMADDWIAAPVLTATAESDETGEGSLLSKRRRRLYRSFRAKLIQSEQSTKEYYVALSKCLTEYEKIRSRETWHNACFYAGRATFAKFAIRGKTLYLYLALDEGDSVGAKYFAHDASEVKRYAKVPTFVKVKSKRGVRYAAELIGLAAQKAGLKRRENPPEVPGVQTYAYRTTESLIACGWIRVIEGEQPKPEDFELIHRGNRLQQSVSPDEADRLMSDRTAERLIAAAADGKRKTGKKFALNIDTIAARFSAGDRVDVDRLKQAGLVPMWADAVKILARGRLDKPLFVTADDFSAQAVKMIVLTGGAIFYR